MMEKVTGYSLLAVGILIIFLSVVSVYQVFTGRAEPMQLFSFSGIGLNPSQLMGGQLPTVPGSKTETKVELVSPDLLNSTSNLFFHLMLMGFIASAGYKAGSLGVQLVRPIKVSLKTKEEKTPDLQEKKPVMPGKTLAASNGDVPDTPNTPG